jgi:hypothetical protein
VQTINKQSLTLDLKKKTMISTPHFIQGDTNILEFTIKENEVNADFSNIGRIVVNYKRSDGKKISRLLVPESNIVIYQLGIEEMEVPKYGEIEIQFFSLDNTERVSTFRFKIYLSESIGTDIIYENSEDLTLLQELFMEVDGVKKSTEAAEATRQQNETTRQSQEALRQANTSNKINEIETRTTAAIGRIDTVVNENKTIWLSPVATFAAITTNYPNALDGSQVLVTDDAPGVQNQYRKINGAWVWTGRYRDNALIDLQTKFNDANMQIQTLSNGVSILTSALNGPVLFEVNGRTLTSLGSSNLEGNKNYLLADKRTKIKAEGREGTLISGVGKFTKSASLITKADFVGKVSGSVTENANKAFYRASSSTITTLMNPQDSNLETSGSAYSLISGLGGGIYMPSNVNNGVQAQTLFSFNIIEQIERKMGRIPSDTVAGKVQWIKDNVARLTANWHGFGGSVGGYGASFAWWSVTGSSWGNVTSHTSGVVAALVRTISASLTSAIDSNGFVHYLAYTTNPSDGIVPSMLHTDFIECEIELKASAVLDTRPIITRVANFEGKVSGSTVENPHVMKRIATPSLSAPSIFTVEPDNSNYGAVSSLNVSSYTTSTNGLNQIAQHLFSFDLIQEVERNIGRIPKATVAEKVQWLKDNVLNLVFEWTGFGSSVGGNKATVNYWVGTWGSSPLINIASSPSKISLLRVDIASLVQSDGFVHYLAYAEPSDGTTASTINTDYISLDITLKQGATLHDPVLPLYEVDATEYGNILVSWDEANVLNRYPKVQGVQHLQNVAVIAEGENLLPPFSELSGISINATIKTPYELEFKPTISQAAVDIPVNVIKNTSYTFNVIIPSGMVVEFRRADNGASILGVSALIGNGSLMSRTFTTTEEKIYIRFYSTGAGTFLLTNPMLTLGSTPKPFVPRNPSYLFASTKLGQVGTVKDSLFKQDGQWQLVERVKKDVVLDGSLGWGVATANGATRRFHMELANPISTSIYPKLLKFDGKQLSVNQSGITSINNDELYMHTGVTPNRIYLAVSNVDLGLTNDSYSIVSDEAKAFFNGWQAKTVDVNGKPTAWRSLGDGTDAPTQTLAYVSTNKAPNFTPYKLSYVLATPQTTVVNHLVEGDIAVSGQTQVEVTSGVIVREKANFVKGTGANTNTTYYLNRNENTVSGWQIPSGSYLKYRTNKIMKIYKNGLEELRAKGVSEPSSNGGQVVLIPQEQYDPTAEYTVTYLVLDRHLHTVNATEVKGSYSGSIKDTVDMNTEKLSDVVTQQSILAMQMYKVLVAAKGAGWNV